MTSRVVSNSLQALTVQEVLCWVLVAGCCVLGALLCNTTHRAKLCTSAAGQHPMLACMRMSHCVAVHHRMCELLKTLPMLHCYRWCMEQALLFVAVKCSVENLLDSTASLPSMAACMHKSADVRCQGI